MYEGRTRGKKLKYTYSDDEDMFSDDLPSRRSTRNAASTAVPAEPSLPRFTASGRQIRSRAGGMYGEALLTGQREDSEYDEEEDDGRPQRARTTRHPNGYSGYNIDDLEDESEAIPSDANDSGHEWNSGQDDENGFEGDEEGEDASGDESIMNGEPPSLVVQLRYGKGNATRDPKVPVDEPPPTQDVHMKAASQSGLSTEPSAPSAAAGPVVDRPSETAQPAPTTTSSFPSVPTPKHSVQPAPVIAAPPTPSVSDSQGPNPPARTNVPTLPAVQLPPVSTPAEAPKSGQPVVPNGLNGSAASVERGAGSEVSLPQAPSTQG